MEFTFFAAFSENVKHELMSSRKQHPVGKEFFLVRFLICFLLHWWEDSAQHIGSAPLKNHHHLHFHSSEWSRHLRNITRNAYFIYCPFLLSVLWEMGGEGAECLDARVLEHPDGPWSPTLVSWKVSLLMAGTRWGLRSLPAKTILGSSGLCSAERVQCVLADPSVVGSLMLTVFDQRTRCKSRRIEQLGNAVN